MGRKRRRWEEVVEEEDPNLPVLPPWLTHWFEMEGEIWIIDESAPVVQVVEDIKPEELNLRFLYAELTEAEQKKLYAHLLHAARKATRSPYRPLCANTYCDKRVPARPPSKRGSIVYNKQKFCSRPCKHAHEEQWRRRRVKRKFSAPPPSDTNQT